MGFPNSEVLSGIYGKDASRAKKRYESLTENFRKNFSSADGAEPEYFTAPGRTEIIGNHTDHNGG